MPALSELTLEVARDLIHAHLVDKERRRVGTVRALRADEESGKIDWIEAKIGGFFGAICLVPAVGADFDRDQKEIRIPYSAEEVSGAPTFAADEPRSGDELILLKRYYGLIPAPDHAPRSDGSTISLTGRPGTATSGPGLTKTSPTDQ
jgi:PRC-barrel domain